MPLSPEAPEIAIFAEPGDGHARSLAACLRSLGARPITVRLSDCTFDTQHPGGIRIDGFGDKLPDAVLVRTIPEGTFEAVTRRLGILHALRESGVAVWNDARAVERCVDKSMTSFLLGNAGIPTPDTWTIENESQAIAVVKRELVHGPLVLKPLFGSQGRGILLIENADQLPEAKDVAGVFYLQRFVHTGSADFHDFRVFVVLSKAVAAMRRSHSHWITNVKQGARPYPALLTPDLSELAVRAALAVGAAFCGVDIISSADGRQLVLEVNSMPAWSGLQKVTKINIAREICSALLDNLSSSRAMRHAG